MRSVGHSVGVNIRIAAWCPGRRRRRCIARVIARVVGGPRVAPVRVVRVYLRRTKRY